MATQLLVTNSIESGRRLLEALDRAGFPVNAAFWYLHDDTWRLLLASSVVDEDGPRAAYTRINKVLQDSGVDLTLSDIGAISAHDPLVRTLRRLVSTSPYAIGGTRFTGNIINNVYIEDAYIYRMA